MQGQKTRPIWAVLTGPYALFLLMLLIVPFASMAMFSLHPYSPTKIALPELTFDNYRQPHVDVRKTGPRRFAHDWD